MIQFLIDGLVNGSIIALGAVGLSISYNVMRFANFAQGEVMAFMHTGFWQPMDTLRDKNQLEHLWNSGSAPWKIWE